MRALLGVRKAEGDPSKVRYIHENLVFCFDVCLQIVKSSRAAVKDYFTTSVILLRV